jgi:hypothetical protein
MSWFRVSKIWRQREINFIETVTSDGSGTSGSPGWKWRQRAIQIKETVTIVVPEDNEKDGLKRQRYKMVLGNQVSLGEREKDRFKSQWSKMVILSTPHNIF